MSRLFNQHCVRTVHSLDGPWEYCFPTEGTVIEPTAWETGEREVMNVPCVWEMLDQRKNYRGQAVARKVVTVAEDCHLLLVFKGVSHTARVYFDGREIGDHHNAFTPFTLDAGKVSAGEHEILVHISNEHGEISALHVPNDYYNYGGISRPVEMHQIFNDVMIRHVHAVTSSEGSGWKVSCHAELINLGDQSRELTLKSNVACTRCENEIVATPGTTSLNWEISCADVKSWSPEAPALYLLKAELVENDRVVDDLVERIGFRTVSVRGEAIFINQKRVFPMGFNRHEDHPLFGCAIPVEVMRSDLNQMRAMHANAVRTSHYPNDERFLDLCDELGLLVWEENHARGLILEKMKHPRFRDQCATCNEEMVREHFNHPSIFVWGILNECASESEDGAAMYQEQFDQIRLLDTSRPLTFASCRHAGDICQGMVDIAAWNIYPQWYSTLSVQEEVDVLVALREKEGMRGKPLILSEFGAGALPGYHDPVRRGKWSEERQCDILDEQLEIILSHPRVGGAFIWQFCDVRVDEAFALNRPRSMNNKGAVDEYRRPKLVFEVIKGHFAKYAARKSES